jgi:hypothetical protein
MTGDVLGYDEPPARCSLRSVSFTPDQGKHDHACALRVAMFVALLADVPKWQGTGVLGAEQLCTRTTTTLAASCTPYRQYVVGKIRNHAK